MAVEERRAVSVRTGLKPGDIGRMIELHGELYAHEHGWGLGFEAFVAEGLGRFVIDSDSEADRFWIAEDGNRLAGCVAIAARPDRSAQLRYFVVAEAYRGSGLGRRLLSDALAFCRDRGYDSVFLWTASDLTAAAHLYRSVGFRLVAEVPESDWGPPVLRQRYVLEL